MKFLQSSLARLYFGQISPDLSVTDIAQLVKITAPISIWLTFKAPFLTHPTQQETHDSYVSVKNHE